MSYQINGTDVIDNSRNANLVSLELTGTGALKIPVGTTAQRPGSPAIGQFRYNSTIGEYEAYDGAQWGRLNAPSIVSYVYSTSNYTLSDNTYLFADTSSGAITVTLPATPAEGTVVYIADYEGSFSVNNVTVNRNGSTILGSASNITLDSTQEYTFYYINSDWRIYINKTLFYGTVAGGGTPNITGTLLPLSSTVNVYTIENYNVTGDYEITVTGGEIVLFSIDKIYWRVPDVQDVTEHTITVTYNETQVGTLTVDVVPFEGVSDDIINYTGSGFGTDTTYTDWTI